MKKTVVIDVVGLSASVIGAHTPFISQFVNRHGIGNIQPMLPAVTTAVQSTYVTGQWPSATGIVGNGWYDREDCEVKFWKQSNKLVQAEKIWDRAKKEDPLFTCANMFWWYNMYSTADYSVTPRPNYLADGRKMPDCYSHPAQLRDELQQQLGQFPLFQFWGPGANIKSSQWIADASLCTDKKYNPTLTLIYLPHLDYCLQKFGPNQQAIGTELQQIDAEVKKLVEYYEEQGATVLLLSEYGIAPVNNPIHINRILRQQGWLQIRTERGLELLDAGASQAFAVADHQVAHVYVNDESIKDKARLLFKTLPGVKLVLDNDSLPSHHLNHHRTGDFVLVADEQSWFTYYFWLNDALAPDYARCVDIHKKPGYDPVEMFMTSKARAGYKLLRKKAGFRYVMDVIPLDATLIKGSHGAVHPDSQYHPIIACNKPIGLSLPVAATEVYNVIWNALVSTDG